MDFNQNFWLYPTKELFRFMGEKVVLERMHKKA